MKYLKKMFIAVIATMLMIFSSIPVMATEIDIPVEEIDTEEYMK